MKHLIILAFVLLIINSFCVAQDLQTWDDVMRKKWPEDFMRIKIKSSIDGTLQKAIFHKTSQVESQPLIVSLHTWSGDYSQEDPLAREVLLRDWNFIHPDFRGANTNPDACGSELVIPDIEDAIQYAIANGNVDKTQVHIIGVSGGGYATLLAFMKINFPVRSFSAWASISNLENWYWECRGRSLKYAENLENVTTGGKGFDATEARKRSPLFMDYKPDKRKGSFLNIYAGIHDGYTGSVPVSQSVDMFNKLLADIYPEKHGEKISESLELSLVAKQINTSIETNFVMGGRKVHLIRELPNLNFIVFEGTHEMLVPQALSLIQTGEGQKAKGLNILTIGDSNGTFKYSWPQQLKRLLPFSTVVNRSISGNTIGFDNLGNEKLNTLKNIDGYLDEAFNELGTNQNFNYILINLGTNDTKKIFEKRQKEVPKNMKLLVQRIRQYMSENQKLNPEICIISPSPMDEQKMIVEKYGGGDMRIQKNNVLFKKLAEAIHVNYLDTYSILKKDFSRKTSDGVHLHDEAQFQMATEIVNWLNTK